MNIKKTAASLLAAATVLVTASGAAVTSSAATLMPPENPEPGLSGDKNMWLIQLYNVGNAEENRPKIEYDIDYSKVAKYSVTVTVVDDERELWDGNIGGAHVLSINGGDINMDVVIDENGNPVYETDENGDIVYRKDYLTGEFLLDENGNKIPMVKINPLWEKYNWVSQSWWGVNDEELGLEAADDQDITAEKVGDYTYKLTTNEYANPLANGDAENIECIQMAFMEWGNSAAHIRVTNVDVLDSSDNILISFDGNGKATLPDDSEPNTSEPDTSEPDTDKPFDPLPDTSEPDHSEPDTSSAPSTPDTSDTSSEPGDTSGTPAGTVEFVPSSVVDETLDEETAQVISEIKVYAPETAFEAGTTLTVKKDDSVDGENLFALDITFTLNGSSVQPKDGAPVTVSVPVPPKFKNVSEDLLKVYHFLNDRYTRVEAAVSNGKITFETSHFSTYVISPDDLDTGNSAESNISVPETSDGSNSNPETGIALSALPIVMALSTVIVIKKKK